MPWRREWPPTPVFWPGEFHGQRSLPGYSQWDRKDSDMTEWLSLSMSTTFMDCSLPSSSVHGISQATILEWVAVSFLLGLNSHLLHWAGAFLPLNHQGHLWGIHYSACQILWNLLTEEHRSEKPSIWSQSAWVQVLAHCILTVWCLGILIYKMGLNFWWRLK